MGDFNVTSNLSIDRPYNSKLSNTWCSETKIFNFLTDWGFTDVHLTWEMEMPSSTWIGKVAYSRIDYIWISTKIAINNIHSFTNEKAEDIVNSDHTLLCLKLYLEGITETSKNSPTRRKGSRIVIKQSAATHKHWKDFSNKTETQMETLVVKTHNLLVQCSHNNNRVGPAKEVECIAMLKKLDEIWKEFASCIIRTAHITLPTEKIKIGNQEKEVLPTSEFQLYRKSLKLKKLLDKAENTREEADILKLSMMVQNFNEVREVT
jgi:hypothetical protein